MLFDKLWSRAVCLASAMALGLLHTPNVAAQEKPKYLLKHKQTKDKAKKATCDCAPKDESPKSKTDEPSNWDFKLRLGSVFQLASNTNVIGKSNGSTRTIGIDVRAGANYARQKHELRNRLDANVVFVNTATTSGWVSATDLLDLESIYQYRSLPWAGPFARAGLSTSMFVGRDLRANDVDYILPDGAVVEDRTELRLTDPFSPVTLLQSVGGFVNPVRLEAFDLDFRAGIGAREVFADGQLGVADENDTTAEVEIADLKSYQQAGLEGIVMIRGILFEKKLQYYFGGEFLLPLIRTREPGDDRSALDLVEKRIRLGVAYQLASWATILAEVRIVNQPQLLDKYQIQQSFGFKASYSVL